MTGADGIDRRTLARIVKRIDPVWEVVHAEAVATGSHPVYRVTVRDPDGETTWVLKATAGPSDHRVGTEARLLAILTESAVPVPAVRGLVEDVQELPTPAMLLNELPGRTHSRGELDALSDDVLGTLAVQVGEQLADLHALDVVDRFGRLAPAGRTYDGGVPEANPEAITVADGDAEWEAWLQSDLAALIERLADTPFADRADTVESVLTARYDELAGGAEPVLARIDQAIENVRIMGDRIVGLLDWEFTLAATPGYDLAHATWSLAGGPYLYGTTLRDRRRLVREHLARGYRSADGPGAADIGRFQDTYDLLIAARSMELVAAWEAEFGFPRSAAAVRSAVVDDFERVADR